MGKMGERSGRGGRRRKHTASEHLARITVRLERQATLTPALLIQVAAHFEQSARRLRDVSSVFDGAPVHNADELRRAHAEVMTAGLQASNALTELSTRCGLETSVEEG